jgi:hypothetical protein
LSPITKTIQTEQNSSYRGQGGIGDVGQGIWSSRYLGWPSLKLVYNVKTPGNEIVLHLELMLNEILVALAIKSLNYVKW